MIKYSILSIKFNKKKQHPFIFKTLKMSQGGAPKIEEHIKKSDGESKKIKLSGNKMILISNDKKSFEIPVEFAEYCGLLKTMISSKDEDSSESDDEEEYNINEIPLPNISSEILIHIIQFIDYTINNNPVPTIPKPITSDNLYEILGPDNKWFADFIAQMSVETLFEILQAANYIDCKTLMNLACVTVATHIKGKTPTQIRDTFNIENDFSPEEELQIREENKWVKETGN